MVDVDKVLKVYNKVGHSSILCFYHFDHAFQTSKNNQASTFVAKPKLILELSWNVNSGAISNVITKLSNLSLKFEDHGEEKLAVDNNNKLTTNWPC